MYIRQVNWRTPDNGWWWENKSLVTNRISFSFPALPPEVLLFYLLENMFVNLLVMLVLCARAGCGFFFFCLVFNFFFSSFFPIEYLWSFIQHALARARTSGPRSIDMTYVLLRSATRRDSRLGEINRREKPRGEKKLAKRSFWNAFTSGWHCFG